MKTLILKDTDEAVKAASGILRENGIVAFPTDTVYGLGAVYTSTSAVKKIFAAKGRDEGKPLSILIGDINQAYLLSDNISANARKLMEAFWPGALTIIVKKNRSVPNEVAAGGDTVGIRMPESDIARAIIKATGSPLAAPSANLSGKRSSVSCEDVIQDLSGRIDMIIDGGECRIGLASTVVDISGDHLMVLREGVITKKQIEEVISQEQSFRREK